MKSEEIFDDLKGKFEARLRDHRTVTRTSKMREGEITLTNPIAVLEVKFDFDVLDRLHEPAFVAIERPQAKGSTFVIYEVVALRPTHFQMLGMDVSMPTVIRKEYLDTISSSWGQSEETWIDVVAVPTEYKMDLVEGELAFAKSRLVPLTGSKVSLLSQVAVKKLLCIEGGVDIGTLLGFDMPLTVNIENIVRYHAGVFGFTGSGKSNFTACLVRKAVENADDLKVIVFDVAGEYSIHLLDLLLKDGMVFSTEDFENNPENFLNSQAIPETLEEKIKIDRIRSYIEDLFPAKVTRLSLERPSEATALTIGYLLDLFESISEKKGSGAVQAAIAYNKIMQHFVTRRKLSLDTDLASLKGQEKQRLLSILNDLASKLGAATALKADIQGLIDYLTSPEPAEEKKTEKEEITEITPEILVNYILSDKTPKVNVVYLPEPDMARYATSRFIERLLLVKKTRGARRKVLVVLDEAQEFIPDRTKMGDFSEQSNRAVESLLRQGRKYRAHCWVSTQRVAHLNVNALQQLHSYFVNTLPRFYDRMVIADAFSLNYDVLDKSTELSTGEWLFVSYKATEQKNVPTFIKVPDNEEILASSLTAFH